MQAAAGAAEGREEDLLGNLADQALVHDFDAWNGIHPSGIEVHTDVHSAREEDEHINVTTRKVKGRVSGLTAGNAAGKTDDPDTDKISVAGSVSDVTPPPPTNLSLIHI